MIKATVSQLSQEIIKALNEKGNEKKLPIFFLGAGASITGGIPSANGIIDRIKKSKLILEDGLSRLLMRNPKATYAEVMNLITPNDRTKLIKDLIDCAKINTTHIYLAQLVKLGYLDFVLTVNFDNLLLKALALDCIFPATYDMAILDKEDITSSSFNKPSVIYLHGRHDGFWSLNSNPELKRVEDKLESLIDSIKDRLWIFVGYSGNDPVFEYIMAIPRFDKHLFWVTYEKNEPSKRVCDAFKKRDHDDCYLIKGYNSDSFFIDLSDQLKLPTPTIFSRPLSSLKKTLDSIVDIDDKAFHETLKKIFKMRRHHVNKAIDIFEEGKILQINEIRDDFYSHLFKEKIISKVVNEVFDDNEIEQLHSKTKVLEDPEISKLFATIYYRQGSALFDSAKLSSNEKYLNLSVVKFQKAVKFCEDNDEYLNYWGMAVFELARIKREHNGDDFEYACNIFESACNKNERNHLIYYNWGRALASCARILDNRKKYDDAFAKFEIATNIEKKFTEAYIEWGISILRYATLIKKSELIKQAIKKFNSAVKINPAKVIAYRHLGIALYRLAGVEKDENLFEESFSKFEEADKSYPNNPNTFKFWGRAKGNLALLQMKKHSKYADETFKESFLLFEKAIDCDRRDSSVYADWGKVLYDKAELNSMDSTYEEAIKKYEESININPKPGYVYYNLAKAQFSLAQNRQDLELFKKSFINLDKAAKKVPKYTSVQKYRNEACSILINSKLPGIKELIRSTNK